MWTKLYSQSPCSSAGRVLHVKNIECLIKYDLKDYEVFIIDNFVADTSSLEEFRNYLIRGEHFRPNDQDTNIRTDQIQWIDNANIDGNINFICTMASNLKTLGSILSGKDIKLSLPAFFQCSLYNGKGSKYIKHRDNKPSNMINIDDDALWFSQRDQRQRYLTCVLYLTPNDWKQEDGGYLRCYLGCDSQDDDGYSAKGIIDIAPLFGRMVVFKSQLVLHEVLPTHRLNRVAITAWLLKETTN